MKVRQGFVTNSSSTCYIIAVPADYRLYQAVGAIPLDRIPDRTKDMYHDGHTFKDPITTVEHFQNEHCGCGRDGYPKSCRRCKVIQKAIEDGLKVFEINLAYYDDEHKDVDYAFVNLRKSHPEIFLEE